MPPGRPPAGPARLRWALEVLDPRPDERLLEVGGGTGVAAALLCPLLDRGHLLVLDRSAVAVRRNRERNAAHLAAGRLAVQETDLAAAELPAGAFDQAFAVDVNLFWVRDPRPDLAVLHRALRPGGRIHLLWGTGPGAVERTTTAAAAGLAGSGFTDVVVLAGPAGRGVSARAQPIRR